MGECRLVGASVFVLQCTWLMRAADDENYADFLVSRETAPKVCVDVKNVLFCFSELRDYRLPGFVSLSHVLFM